MDAPSSTTTATALVAMTQALDAVDHSERQRLEHRARLALVDQARRVLVRTEALLGALVAEADKARSSTVVSRTPTSSWLQSTNVLARGEAAGLVLGSKEVAGRPGLQGAALSGQVNTRQARSIAKVIGHLPGTLTPRQRDAAEAWLITEAAHTDAGQLAKLGDRVLDVVAPEAADSPEQVQSRLEAQQRRAHAARSLSFTDDGDGSYVVQGNLPHLQATPLLKILQAKVDAGRRRARDLPRSEQTAISIGQRWADALTDLVAGLSGMAANKAAPVGTIPSGTDHVGTTPSGADRGGADRVGTTPGEVPPDGTTSQRVGTVGSTRAEPLRTTVADAEPDARTTPSAAVAPRVIVPNTPDAPAAAPPPNTAAPPGGIPTVAGERPRIVVILDYDTLHARAEQSGLLDTGQSISAGDLRRLACDADLVPAVLGRGSELLDYGTTVRLVPAALRRALSLRDGGCTFPGCEAPDTQCDAHHIVPWWAGGDTSLRNLVLLCPHHHAMVEPPRFWSGPPPDRWHLRLDQRGHAEFIPPRSIDPTQTPRGSRRGLAARR